MYSELQQAKPSLYTAIQTVKIVGINSFWTSPWSGILKKTTFPKLDLFPSSGEGMEGFNTVCSVRES
jgi:hypothetical protein